jgi:tRNA 2-thiouridine synthesizing protein E
MFLPAGVFRKDGAGKGASRVECFQVSGAETPQRRRNMGTVEFKSKSYEVDDEGFLKDPQNWDENFSEGMAPTTGINEALNESHWNVIRFIRESVSKSGRCPMIYEVCRTFGLRLTDLQKLFPSGYLRGACKLAGLTYREGPVHAAWLPKQRLTDVTTPLSERTYRVDIQGFLIDSSEWDEEYAIFRSEDMKMPDGLTERHWRIIDFLRTRFKASGKVPTVFETCEANRITIEDLEHLFPDGYHRGAVKIAGLRAR